VCANALERTEVDQDIDQRVEVGDRGADTVGCRGELHLGLAQVGSAVEQGSWQSQGHWLQRWKLRQGVRQVLTAAGAPSNQNIEGQAGLVQLTGDHRLRGANCSQILARQVELDSPGEARPMSR